MSIAPHPPAAPKLAYGLAEGMALIGKSRAAAYRAMARGDLQFYMDGARRMVTHQALLDYIALMVKRTQEQGSIAPNVRRRRRRPAGAA